MFSNDFNYHFLLTLATIAIATIMKPCYIGGNK